MHADAELQLGRFRNGDEAAALYMRKRLFNLMLREAYSVLSHPQDAEDAVEDAFARLWRFRDRLPADWEGARKYILRVVHNVARDQRRNAESRVQKVELEEYLETPKPIEPPAEVVERIAARTASELLAKMRDRHYRVLAPVAQRLSLPYQDMQQVYADVADALGTSSGYVRNTWSEIGKEFKRVHPAEIPDPALRELLRVIGTHLEPLAA